MSTKDRKQQSLIEGALVLALASLIVKIIGAIYKVPMIAVIGTDGNGYYTYAYNIYLVIYAIAVSGFPTAISKIVAEYRVQGRYKDIARVKRVATVLMLGIGVAGSLILLLAAKPYAEWTLKIPLAYYAILAVTPSILFSCLMATHRGFTQGLSNMTPTAISQLLEVLVKVAAGLGGSYLVKKKLTEEFLESGTVLGKFLAIGEKPEVIIQSYSAAAAIFGVTLSVFVGYLYFQIRDRFRRELFTQDQIAASPDPDTDKVIAKKILAIGVPIALSTVTVYVAGFIDGITVTDRLIRVFVHHPKELFDSFHGLLDLAGKTMRDAPSEIANYLYGAYGLSSPLFNLIPSITGAFGISSMPHVAAAWRQNNLVDVKRHSESVIRLTMIIAAPLGCGIFALCGPITRFLYAGRNPVSAEIAYPMVGVLGLVAIIVAVSASINSLLQGIGRIDAPVKLLALGVFSKVAFNFILVGVPSFNVKALPYSNLLCYVIISVLAFYVFYTTTGIGLSFFDIIIKPLIAGGGCGLAAFLANFVLLKVLINRTSVCMFISIITGAVAYVVLLGVLKAIKREDCLSLPGGTRIVRVLEKLRIL